MMKHKLIKPQQHVSVGVFDAKWMSEYDILIANSSGEASIYNYNNETQDILLEGTLKISESFCLSVDYSRQNKNTFIAGSSMGEVVIFERTSSELNLVKKISDAHFNKYTQSGAEIWSLSSNKFNSTFVTGAEDQKVKIWDMKTHKIVSQITKDFEAGVCCVESSKYDENIIITGCYDGYIRQCDLRNISKPTKIINCEAGPWTIKYHPKQKNIISVACMRNGFFVVDLDKLNDESKLSELIENKKLEIFYNENCDFLNYESLAYGIDFLKEEKENKYKIVTASFYNKTINILNN